MFLYILLTHIRTIYIYNMACNALYLRSKGILFICPITFTDKRRDIALNRIYLSLTFILYIYYAHTHTQVYSYISVIWSKTTFICVLSEFYGVSL